jgi:DNA-binding transcriptional ArsR family regulator
MSESAAPNPHTVDAFSESVDTMDPTTTGDHVFETVAELFAVLSAPIRLKIISAVCQEERNVSELLQLIDTTQPNMSQHLNTLYRCGVLAKRREGTQIYYRLQNEFVATLCRTVCTQVAIEMDPDRDAAAVRDITSSADAARPVARTRRK